MSHEAILKMENIRKTFPGVVALDGAELELYSGSVHALMGENGAGKSTLMKCLFGVIRPDGGKITLFGREVCFKSSAEALASGVAMVHQELNQAQKLSVAENMWLGRFPRINKHFPFIDERKMVKKTKDVLNELGISVDPEAKMETLSVCERQMVEIARAVSFGARIIVFDEPTSSLTESEAERLFGIIELLKSKGCGIVYISHKMNEILKICDTVTVMRDGHHVITAAADGLNVDRIIHYMVGRTLTERFPKRKRQKKEPLLVAEDISGAHTHLSGASLTLGRGEVLGIGGLDGSGRTELIEAIFGLSRRRSGRLYLDGVEIYNKNPADAKKNGFALLTEERRRDGIFSILGVRENVTISSLSDFSLGPFLSERKMSEATEKYIKRLRIKTPSDRARIGSLSGGNQQKAILARWLLTSPRVLLLDEPTRGIDVGAKYEIYTLINELAEDGCGIILVSSEMPELLGMSDRILVMSGGRVAGELDAATATQEKIMDLAAKYV